MYIIIIVILLFLILYKKKETFQDNLSVLITKSYYSENKLTIENDNTDINDNLIIQMLSNIFPLNYKQIDYNNINNNLLLVPQMYNTQLIKNNYKFVASLYPISLTMILPINSNVSNYKDFENIKIATLKNCSHDFLYKFSQIMNMNLDLVICENYKDIYTKWKDKTIDAIFIIVSHPNQFIKLFSYQEEIKLFDWNTVFENENLKRIINFHFQDIKKISIPIQTYRLFKLSQYYNTYGFYVNILANKNIPDYYIYNLLKTIYTNNSKIKVNLPFTYSLTPEWMSFCPPNMEYHIGAKQFYTDINSISEFDDKCYLLNSTCNNENIDSIDGVITKRMGII